MDVYSLVERCKGVVTWKFRQNRHLAGGVCAALSASWINYHAHGDSLANHVKASCLRQDFREASNIRHLQAIFASTPKVFNGVDKWLQMQGMVIDNNSTFQAYTDCPDTENYIVTQLAKHRASYAYVTFGEAGKVNYPSYSHAVAVYIGGYTETPKNKNEQSRPNIINGDACFFDPDWGEFWFERKQDFFRYFLMYVQAYRTRYGLSLLSRGLGLEYFTIIKSGLSTKPL